MILVIFPMFSSSPGNPPRGLSLKVKLTGMMLLATTAIAAIVHIPWVYTSRRNVEQIVSQLHEESFHGAQNDAAAFFENVLGLQHIMLSSLDDGLVELGDIEQQGALFLNLLHSHENFTWVQIGFANGDFLGAQRREDGLYNLDVRQWDDPLGTLAEPGTPLAQAQNQRAQQAEALQETGDPSVVSGRPDWRVRTLRFDENQGWVQVDRSRREEYYYAPIRPWYQAAAENPGENVWTEVYRFKTGNVVGLDAATTYSDPETGQVRAVVSISFGLRSISEYLSGLKTPSEGLLFILDDEGNLIAASDPSVLAASFESATEASLMSLAAIENPVLQTVHQGLQDKRIDLTSLVGMEELSQYDSVTGKQYYIAVSPLGQLDWTIGSVSPEEVYLASVNRNQRRLLVMISGLLGLGMIVLWQVSDRLLIRPIVAVSDAAAAMEAGDFQALGLEQTAQRNDEMGRLAQVFQNMAAVIGDREKSLRAQLADLRDSGTGMAGSQLELAYYTALTERAAQLKANGASSPQFPPSSSLSAYYRALKNRAESVRSTWGGGAAVEQLLRNEPYLANLPDGDLRELASSAQQITLEGGEGLFQEGDVAKAVYAIASGSIEILSTSQDAPLRIVQAGQVFGELNLMLDIPRTTSARSRENTTLYALERDIFARILRNNPQVIDGVEQKLASFQDVLADAQLWFGEGNLQQEAGVTWHDQMVERLRQWWQPMSR